MSTYATPDIEGTDRPESCDCREAGDALPCWPCYRAGFDEPNPEATLDE